MEVKRFANLRMPGGDGGSLMRAVREEEARRVLPRTAIVLCSGAHPVDPMVQSAAGLHDALLTKPVDMHELLEVVRQLGVAASPTPWPRFGLSFGPRDRDAPGAAEDIIAMASFAQATIAQAPGMPPSDSPTRPLYDGKRYDYTCSVGHQLFHLLQLMRREVEQRMAAYDLTDAQWKPLWLLAIGRASTAIELARELDMDPGALSRLLDRLAAKDLIARERSDADRRVVHLRLTAAGREVADHVPHVLAAVNNDFLAGFSRPEWQQLLDQIGRMVDNGQALLAQRAPETVPADADGETP